MEFESSATIPDILRKIKSENATCDILVKSGKNFSGTIQFLNNFIVVLQLTGARSFYDAIIRVEDISVIEIKARSS